jgi:protoporphyrinogen/coproporphyrinogen III oxidase
VRARVVVVGGGISGLATAYRLAALDPPIDVTLLEATERTGGKLQNVVLSDFELPAGADSFLARKPWAVDLCTDLGVAGELVSPGASGAHLWTSRGLVPLPRDAPFGIPGDVGTVLGWPGLSGPGRRRALLDLIKPKRRVDADESLGSLLRRRLGDEATDMAVAPLLAGLHAGDVDLLSVRATFPDLERCERWQGSLIRGAQAANRQARRGNPAPMFLRPRGGVQRLAEALADSLGSRVRTGARVQAIEGTAEDGWLVLMVGDEAIDADAVVLAVPAPVAAHLVPDVGRKAASELGGIPYTATAVVLMVYGEGTRSELPDGTGFVVPRGRAPMTATTWLSSKWPSEAFGTRAIVRCYVGAAGEGDVVVAPDDDIVDACARHLAALVQLPDRPEHATVVRWPASMPQYEVGHLERVARIRAALPPGIFVAGQAYDGVGIPDCVRSANEAAATASAYLTTTPIQQETVP